MFHSIQNLLFREAGFPPLNSDKSVWSKEFKGNPKAQTKAIKLMLKSAVIVDRFCGFKKPLSFTEYLKNNLRQSRFNP